jgi:hypothetical protein
LNIWNGISGDGEWFYQRWQNAVESDDIFVNDQNTNFEKWNQDLDIDNYIKDPRKNSFIKVRFHWSEDPRRNQNWYEQQKRELDDPRKVNQELDLIFVGTSKCIFDDDQLSSLESQQVKYVLPCKYDVKLKVFEENIDPRDYYLIGVDTSTSVGGESAYNAIEIFSFKEFNQVAEAMFRLASYTRYGEVIDDVFQWLYKIVGPRIILAIERNTIGRAPIEHLLNYVKTFDYSPFVFSDNDKDPGIYTSGISKDLMVGCFKEVITENPKCVKSRDLINQMSSIERSNSGTIRSQSFSDLFMATCFCAYTRKRRALDIMPLLMYSNKQLDYNFRTNMSELISLNDPKRGFKDVRNISIDPSIFVTTPDLDSMDTYSNSSDLNDIDIQPFMPFFNI